MEEKKYSIDRDRFTFYKSYYDTYKELPIKDRPEFIETIMAVYFLEKKLEDVKPSTPMLKLAFSSISHSIKTSIKGLFDKLKIDYNSYPYQGAYEGAYQQHTISNKQQAIDNKKDITYSSEFERVWKDYPSSRREDKVTCYKYWKEIPEEKKELFYGVTKNYISNNTKENYKYVKKSHRWFKDWETQIEADIQNKPTTLQELRELVKADKTDHWTKDDWRHYNEMNTLDIRSSR